MKYHNTTNLPYVFTWPRLPSDHCVQDDLDFHLPSPEALAPALGCVGMRWTI